MRGNFSKPLLGCRGSRVLLSQTFLNFHFSLIKFVFLIFYLTFSFFKLSLFFCLVFSGPLPCAWRRVLLWRHRGEL